MPKTEIPPLTSDVVSEVSRIVSKISGIQLNERQHSMVRSRLTRRIAQLGLSNEAEYFAHLQRNTEAEIAALVSLLTTHHTYFFREFSHFEYLERAGLERVARAALNRSDKTLRVWSAACSRGHEVYSLAMFLSYHLPRISPDLSYEILGTDIDPESVAIAKNGVYRWDELKDAPLRYMGAHWARGTGEISDFVKAKASIKSKCRFEALNLLHLQDDTAARPFDLIFCRNVFIYFNPTQTKEITRHLLKRLPPHGLFFVGISESLSNMGLPLSIVGPSIYAVPTTMPAGVAPVAIPASQPQILKVLCVDDSPTILAMLKRVLTPDKGFEVVATAINPIEAAKLLKEISVDALTMDIHMPEQTGLEYLERNFNESHPPVVMVSTVSRDDPEVAAKCLRAGASDYIEKPTLATLGERGNEIRSKLWSAWRSRQELQVPFIAAKKTKVLIVDDSPSIRTLLEKVLSADPGIEVVGTTGHPLKVESLIHELHPDVMTLDIHMPEIDGPELLERLLPNTPIPTVMVTSVSKEDGTSVFRALEAGAVDYIQKPSLTDLPSLAPMIVEKVKTAASAQVFSRKTTIPSRRMSLSSSAHTMDLNFIIAIGSSTGGTEALREILAALPSAIPPIVIAQHIPPFFSAAFADRLNKICEFEVKEAESGDSIRPSRVLIAPGGRQLRIAGTPGKWHAVVEDAPKVNHHSPSVDVLFDSVAAYVGKSAIGIILTGMGKDGAQGLLKMKQAGAYTIAQDEASSVVFGMPREAVRIGAVDFVCPLSRISDTLLDVLRKKAA